MRYDNVTYDEVLQKHLGVMDASAIALARDNNLPIIVFSLDEPGGFKGILAGEGTYTTLCTTDGHCTALCIMRSVGREILGTRFVISLYTCTTF